MNTDFQFYLALLKKRLPVMSVILFLGAAIGLGLALTLPPRYVADARLLVESAQIPDTMAVSTVQTSSEKQLQIIEQRLMTRANMIDVANKYRVFDDQANMDPNQVFKAMRDVTSIWVDAGDPRRATVMSISFRADDPETASAVVNEFVNLVETESAGIREVEAGETAIFFESEVKRLTEELSRRSAKIVEFKEANKDALPEELDYRLTRESQIQDQLNLSARDRQSLNEQLDRLRSVGSANQIDRPTLSPEQQKLADLRSQLSGALAVYSETNPRVRALRAQIEALESTMSPNSGPAQDIDPLKNMLDMQIAQLQSRIEFLSADITRSESELAELRSAIEKTPQNKIRLDALDRDYANVLLQYNQAVASLAKAKVGESIEVQGKGERVSVIERAIPPTSPASPNRKLIAGGGLFAGTALAVMFFVLTELLNRSIRRPTDLVRGLGVQPLATIPFLDSEVVQRRRRVLSILALLAVLIAVGVALWAVHTFYLPLDLLADKLLKSLGL